MLGGFDWYDMLWCCRREAFMEVNATLCTEHDTVIVVRDTPEVLSHSGFSSVSSFLSFQFQPPIDEGKRILSEKYHQWFSPLLSLLLSCPIPRVVRLSVDALRLDDCWE